MKIKGFYVFEKATESVEEEINKWLSQYPKPRTNPTGLLDIHIVHTTLNKEQLFIFYKETKTYI